MTFDAVSIHPTSNPVTVDTVHDQKIEVVRTTTRTTADGYEAQNATLKFLIATAYNLKDNAISGGPDWLNSDHYDLIAKITASDESGPPALTAQQRREMLRAVLADRFHLMVHAETKDGPVFDLALTKNGPKFHQATPNDTFAKGVTALDGRAHPGSPMMVRPGNVVGQGITLASLNDLLTQIVHRPIIDKTGLTGRYDISLEWKPDNIPDTSPLADSSAPSIFTAVQEQLGLKLSPSTAPLDVLVIDSAQKPTPN
ncbi:MAG TPA: TIGR03435 family protein [Acidobacteriaceae bacterium]|nr:TIGR03435 family protein [Acidobacteriaceae bacterium]